MSSAFEATIEFAPSKNPGYTYMLRWYSSIVKSHVLYCRLVNHTSAAALSERTLQTHSTPTISSAVTFWSR